MFLRFPRASCCSVKCGCDKSYKEAGHGNTVNPQPPTLPLIAPPPHTTAVGTKRLVRLGFSSVGTTSTLSWQSADGSVQSPAAAPLVIEPSALV